MPKKNTKDKRKSSRPKKRDPTGRENTMTHYNGPIHLPSASESTRPVKVNSTYYAAATTSAGGVIDVVFGNSPAVLAEWSSWQSLYHQYRVLGVKLEYVPVKNVANWAYGFGQTVVDRSNSAALGGITAATNHESVKIHQMYNTWTREAKMSGVQDGGWIDIQSPVATFYVKCYSAGNSTIQTIGGFFLEYLIEFRVKS